MSAVEFTAGLFTRGFKPPLVPRDFRPITFNRDSTLVSIACIDEIGAGAGLHPPPAVQARLRGLRAGVLQEVCEPMGIGPGRRLPSATAQTTCR